MKSIYRDILCLFKKQVCEKRIAINAAVTHLKTFLSSAYRQASPGINSSQTHNDVVLAHKEQNSHYKTL